MFCTQRTVPVVGGRAPVQRLDNATTRHIVLEVNANRVRVLLVALPVLSSLLTAAITLASLRGGHDEVAWADADATLTLDTPGSLSAMGAASTTVDTLVLSGTGGTVLQPAAGLGDESGTASGWSFDRERVTPDTVRTLAGRFGIDGSCADGDVCRVNDGEDSITVGDDHLALLTVYLGSRAPRPCQPSDAGCAERYRRELPSELEVSRDAQRLLRDAGLDPARFVWDVYLDGEHTVRGVATLRLGGVVLPMRWIIDYSVNGVYSVNGFLAAPVEITGYETVGPTTAALRSADARWSAVAAVPRWESPLTAETDRRPSARFGELVDSWYRTTADRPLRHEGRPVLDPGTEVRVVETAELSLFLYRGLNGAPLLLPAWLLRSSDGAGWFVPAVADRHAALPTAR